MNNQACKLLNKIIFVNSLAYLPSHFIYKKTNTKLYKRKILGTSGSFFCTVTTFCLFT